MNIDEIIYYKECEQDLERIRNTNDKVFRANFDKMMESQDLAKLRSRLQKNIGENNQLMAMLNANR